MTKTKVKKMLRIGRSLTLMAVCILACNPFLLYSVATFGVHNTNNTMARNLRSVVSSQSHAKKREEKHQTTSIILSRYYDDKRTGSWLGNQWIPPDGWQLYSQYRIQNMMQNKSILWLGDSTGRRAAMTLYGVLYSKRNHYNHNNATVVHAAPTSTSSASSLSANEIEKFIDLNRHNVTHPCQRDPFVNQPQYSPPVLTHANPSKTICFKTPKDYVWMRLNCYSEIEYFVQQELVHHTHVTKNIDLLIVATGTWYTYKYPDHCGIIDRRIGQNETTSNCVRTPTQQIQDLFTKLQQLLELRPHLTILWRTSGYDGDNTNPNIQTNVISQMNQVIMDAFDHQLSSSSSSKFSSRFAYVNFGGAIEPRSFGNDRLQGDISAHYDLNARLVMIQMIANTLQDMLRSTQGSS